MPSGDARQFQEAIARWLVGQSARVTAVMSAESSAVRMPASGESARGALAGTVSSHARPIRMGSDSERSSRADVMDAPVMGNRRWRADDESDNQAHRLEDEQDDCARVSAQHRRRRLFC